MRRIKAIILLGMVACVFVFKSYFDHVVWNTDEQHQQGRLRTFQSPGLNTPARHPTPIVILTYMRSGSSFVGDVLQQNKDVFYLFEPLRLPQFAIRKNRTYHSLNGDKRFYNSFLDVGQDIIRNWTNCNLFDLPDVVWSDSFTSKSKKAKILKACRIFQSNLRPMNETLRYCVNMLRSVCFQSKYMVLKVIRFPVDKLEPLMAEFPSMKIVHLVRDPRATVLSQMKFGIIKRKSFVTDVIDFCSRVYRDIVTTDIFINKFPNRILTYFYEELARNPLDMSKSLYKFAGIQYTKEVEDFVYNITMAGKKSNCGSLCTIKSNSSAQADAWRLKLNLPQARVIDQACRPVYKRLGFKEIISEEMLLNNEIPLRLEPGQSYDYRFA